MGMWMGRSHKHATTEGGSTNRGVQRYVLLDEIRKYFV